MQPSHDKQAERSVLGAMLIDPAVEPELCGLCTDDFFFAEHQEIHRAMCELSANGDPIDEVTVQRKGCPFSLLSELAEVCPTAANATHYAKIVTGHSRVRQYNIRLRPGVEYGEDHDDQALNLSQDLCTIAASNTRAAFRSAKEIAADEMARLEERMQRGTPDGLMTGIKALDKITQGLDPGNVVIIGGRTSMGKTALAVNIATNVGLDQRKQVAFVSLEMSEGELLNRVWSSCGGIDGAKIKAGKLGREDMAKLARVSERIHQGKLQINDLGLKTVPALRVVLRQMAAKEPLALVVIDYLQLMRGEGRSREERVADVSVGLKDLFKELGCPGLVLAQVNRESEKKGDSKRPGIADLRDSGAVEQDADKILLVYRDAYYNKNAPKDEAEIIVGKQRNGPTGTIKVKWDGRYARFYDEPDASYHQEGMQL